MRPSNDTVILQRAILRRSYSGVYRFHCRYGSCGEQFVFASFRKSSTVIECNFVYERIAFYVYMAGEIERHLRGMFNICPEVKLGRIPPDHRSGTSYLRSTTSINRYCIPQLRSGTFLLGSTLCTVYIWVFFCVCIMFCKKCSPSRSFCHLHLLMLGVNI